MTLDPEGGVVFLPPTMPLDPDYVNTHAARMRESMAIKDAGQLAASVHAAFLVLKGIGPDEAIKQKEGFLRRFTAAGRKDRIEQINIVQGIVDCASDSLNPGCRETQFAFAARRLELIGKIVQVGVAEGLEAVKAADILMRNCSFGLEGSTLVLEWKNGKNQNL